jgi:hypothetical protein
MAYESAGLISNQIVSGMSEPGIASMAAASEDLAELLRLFVATADARAQPTFPSEVKTAPSAGATKEPIRLAYERGLAVLSDDERRRLRRMIEKMLGAL